MAGGHAIDVGHVATPEAPDQVAASQLGAHAVATDAKQLGELDGIVIATPASRHAEDVLGLLPRDTPLFVEKPLATSTADAITITQRADGRVFVMDK
jgi:predicted dehydrogenase